MTDGAGGSVSVRDCRHDLATRLHAVMELAEAINEFIGARRMKAEAEGGT